MQIIASTPEDYIEQLPEDRQHIIQKLREQILKNIPKGFAEEINYGMIGYVVPHSIYPKGYHCDITKPLPFMNIASQKNFVAVYHLGIYADNKLMKWFTDEYSNHCKTKIDMGKSCIRFKKMSDVPYELIGKLAKKVSVNDWINVYEKNVKR